MSFSAAGEKTQDKTPTALQRKATSRKRGVSTIAGQHAPPVIATTERSSTVVRSGQGSTFGRAPSIGADSIKSPSQKRSNAYNEIATKLPSILSSNS